MSQTQRLSVDRILDVLKDYYDIEDWEIDRMERDYAYIPATSERPAITITDERLYIEYPDEYEEIPNPNAANFYPNLWDEVKNPEDLKEYLDPETVEKIIQGCRGAKEEEGVIYTRSPFMDCVIERAYEEIEESLKKEAEEEIKRIRKSKPKHASVCGVPITIKLDIYEETRYDNLGNEYTALIPSEVYIIDLDKVPDEDTLRCLLEHHTDVSYQ